MRRTGLLLAGTLLLAGPLAAQASGPMPESYRQVQMSALEVQRNMMLAMLDSMPERLYRDKAAPGQRDFAEQIEHVGAGMVFLVTTALGVPAPAPDDTTHLNSRAGMRRYITGVYDWAANLLRTQSAADRARTVKLFGKSIPAWQVWDEVNQHTIWTAGQVVANFRKHGMAPPGFALF